MVTQRSTTIAFVLLILASLLSGWCLPAFYAWTDSDQSRPSPLLWQMPMCVAAAATIFCAVLPWLRIADVTRVEPASKKQFGLKQLLIFVALFAGVLALLAKAPNVGGGFVTVGMIAYFVRFFWRNPAHRLAAAALAACMVLPYTWLISYSELDRLIPAVVTMIGIFPTFFPAAWLCYLVGERFRDHHAIGFLLTAAELAVGLWLIRLGPKRTIAYLIFAMIFSWVGSLAFYQMMRA